MGSELELSPFLTAFVHFVKPEIIVETGTYQADGTLALARGCELNGFGHVWTYELEEPNAISCRERIAQEGLDGWVTVLCEDATHATWEGPPIELFFCDGGYERYKEIQNFDPWFAARCTILAHDAADSRYGWGNLGENYLPVMIPSARGLWIMRKFTNTPIGRT